MTKSFNSMGKTMFLGIGGVLAATFAMTAIASADTSGAKYCQAVADKYERYLIGESRNRPPQGIDARVAVEKCKAGDPSGIAAIEKALQNAKIALPPRS